MKTVFIAGHARLPAGMAAQNMYETLTITAEIDKKYSVIVAASCTLATVHGQEFVHQLLRGTACRMALKNRWLTSKPITLEKLEMHWHLL